MKLSLAKNNAIYVANSSSSHSAGQISVQIVNSESNGKRIKLSTTLFKGIGSPQKIEIFHDDTIFYLVPSENGIKVSKGNTIYNNSIVQELTEFLGLDFSERTSHSVPAIIDRDEESEQLFAYLAKK